MNMNHYMITILFIHIYLLNFNLFVSSKQDIISTCGNDVANIDETDLPNWPKYSFDSSSINLLTSKFSHFHCSECNNVDVAIAKAIKTAVIDKDENKINHIVNVVAENENDDNADIRKIDNAETKKENNSVNITIIQLTPIFILILLFVSLKNLSKLVNTNKQLKSKLLEELKDKNVVSSSRDGDDDIELPLDYLLKYKDFIEISEKPDVIITEIDQLEVYSNHSQVEHDLSHQIADSYESPDQTFEGQINDYDPTYYYNDFWEYANAYGEDMARQYYGPWSPPEEFKSILTETADNNSFETSSLHLNSNLNNEHSYSKEDLEIQELVSSFNNDMNIEDDDIIDNSFESTVYKDSLNFDEKNYDPTAYYNDFWKFAEYYGEDAAREYYGEWSPPIGSKPPTVSYDNNDNSTDYANSSGSFQIDHNDQSYYSANSNIEQYSIDPYDEFWRYAAYYGEDTARQHFGDKAPPDGVLPLYDYSLLYQECPEVHNDVES